VSGLDADGGVCSRCVVDQGDCSCGGYLRDYWPALEISLCGWCGRELPRMGACGCRWSRAILGGHPAPLGLLYRVELRRVRLDGGGLVSRRLLYVEAEDAVVFREAPTVGDLVRVDDAGRVEVLRSCPCGCAEDLVDVAGDPVDVRPCATCRGVVGPDGNPWWCADCDGRGYQWARLYLGASS